MAIRDHTCGSCKHYGPTYMNPSTIGVCSGRDSWGTPLWGTPLWRTPESMACPYYEMNTRHVLLAAVQELNDGGTDPDNSM